MQQIFQMNFADTAFEPQPTVSYANGIPFFAYFDSADFWFMSALHHNDVQLSH